MRKILSVIYGVLFVLVITLLIIIYSPREVRSSKVSFITDSGAKEISVEIADNHMERAMGLMNRTSLAEDSGMLFIFDSEGTRSFWMKDTLIPLDMIFVSGDMKIVHIEKNVQPCRQLACDHYSSIYPAKYVVEVNAGFSDMHGIETGDNIEISMGG